MNSAISWIYFHTILSCHNYLLGICGCGGATCNWDSRRRREKLQRTVQIKYFKLPNQSTWNTMKKGNHSLFLLLSTEIHVQMLCTKALPLSLFQLFNTSSSVYIHADFIATHGISHPISPVASELRSEAQIECNKKYPKRIRAISLEFFYIKYFRLKTKKIHG